MRRAIAMPSGRPMMKQTSTARMVTSSRSMLSCQRPKTPKSRKVTTTRMVERRPATAQASHAKTATTPSHPIWGTGRGNAGMLTSFCRNVKMLLKVSPMNPSTPPKNQLSGPCSCTQSRIRLSHSWKSVVSWSPRARVSWFFSSAKTTSQTTRMPRSSGPVCRFLPRSM